MHTARARCPAHRWCPPSSSTRQAVTRSTLPKPTVRTILTTNTTSRCAAASAPPHTRCSPHRPSALPSAVPSMHCPPRHTCCRCSVIARPWCGLSCGDARARNGGDGGGYPRASSACTCAAPTRPWLRAWRSVARATPWALAGRARRLLFLEGWEVMALGSTHATPSGREGETEALDAHSHCLGCFSESPPESPTPLCLAIDA